MLEDVDELVGVDETSVRLVEFLDLGDQLAYVDLLFRLFNSFLDLFKVVGFLEVGQGHD